MWLDLIDDDRGVRAIYGDKPPALGRVVLHEVTLHRDGPRAVLRFDLPEYPTEPPRKWLDLRFNVVQIQLMLIGVHDISMSGWRNSPGVELSIERDGQGIRVVGSEGSMRIDVRADNAVIAALSAYQDDADEEL